MAKAPRAGTVKTRLHPLLGPPGCARLQQALIRHTVGVARELAPGNTFLAFDPPDAAKEIAGLVAPDVMAFPQTGGDLGRRLDAATAEVFARRAGPLLVIGTDLPTLTTGMLRQAGTALRDGADVVFGPAVDGGYYLVGMGCPRPALFAIESGLWGGDRVLAASLAAAARAGLDVTLLAPLRDLDTPADAQALLLDPQLPAEIAEQLRQ